MKQKRIAGGIEINVLLARLIKVGQIAGVVFGVMANDVLVKPEDFNGNHEKCKILLKKYSISSY